MAVAVVVVAVVVLAVVVLVVAVVVLVVDVMRQPESQIHIWGRRWYNFVRGLRRRAQAWLHQLTGRVRAQILRHGLPQ